MYARVLELTISAVMLTYGAVGACTGPNVAPTSSATSASPTHGPGRIRHDGPRHDGWRHDGPWHDGWGRDGAAPGYVAHHVCTDRHRWRWDHRIAGVPGGSRTNL